MPLAIYMALDASLFVFSFSWQHFYGTWRPPEGWFSEMPDSGIVQSYVIIHLFMGDEKI